MGVTSKSVGTMRSIMKKLDNGLLRKVQEEKEKKEKKEGKGARQAGRLDSFYDELKAIHKEYFVDWRFGQLVTNFLCWFMNDKGMDIFFPEEDKMLEYIREYSEQYRTEYPVYINDDQSNIIINRIHTHVTSKQFTVKIIEIFHDYN